MELIGSVLGVFGGGWGSFAAILALGGFAWFAYVKFKQAKQQKAKDDTADQHTLDKNKQTKKNDQQAGQIQHDDKANEP